VLDDLMARPGNTVAAYRAARRFEQGFRPAPLPATQRAAFRDGGTYLITGGFGGIGMTLAADILRRHKARVILLSRDAMPPRETWDTYLAQHGTAERTARRMRAIIRLEKAAQHTGGTVELAVGNVANLAQMRRVIDGIGAGGLTGVVHAAGVLDDGPLLAKSDAQIEGVLLPKVQGLRVLDQLLPDGALELMVLFSSTSTATRAAGQVDYVAANAFLNAFAKARRGCATRVLAINWGVWADVGMAAEMVGGVAGAVLPPHTINAVLLKTAGADAAGDTVMTAPLSTDDWLLDQHRTSDGMAVMPGTGFVEILAEAAQAQGLTDSFEISDLYFLRALSMTNGSQRQMRVTLKQDGTAMNAELRSDCTVGGKSGWQLHAQARLSALSDPVPDKLDLGAIADRCTADRQIAGEHRLSSPQEAHLKFGPSWHVLRETRLGADEGLADLALPDAVQGDRATGHLLHAGLMDLATGWAMHLVEGYTSEHLWVPVSYGRIRVHAPLPAAVRSWVRLAQGGGADGFARFDVTICDADGTVLVEVSDFAMKRLEGAFAATPLDPREVMFDRNAEDEQALSPAEERLAYMVSQGIRAAEGPEALRRALALDLPQVMVSAMPLADLIVQADTPVQTPVKSGQSFERPDLDGSYVAPRNVIEAKLAAVWQTLLGIDPVGVDDSFFDLGGHSLIAVRLFATIKREFKVEFPISVLFEAPTIAKCAALIAAQTGASAGAVDDMAQDAPLRDRFDYLVPLNASDQKDAAPLFVVAGMFGNVLNLRHLALPFSAERPVVGVQARGLIGDAEPHTDVAQAAADYLREMRRLQPVGPYLLAGYSGGGITAYEMAQQLRAAGEEVAVLAMLDTPLPVRPPLSRRDKIIIKSLELRRKGPAYLVEWARNRWAWERGRRAGRGAETPAVPGTEFNNTKIEQAFLRAVGAYDTRPWGGPLTLFRPPIDRTWRVSEGRWVSAVREYVFDDNAWRQYAPDLTVIEVPGDHVSMVLAPNVTVLAQELAEVIAGAVQQHSKDTWPRATAAE